MKELTIYILKRIGLAVFTLFVLVTLTFFMMRMLPGEPFMGEKALPEATKAALQAQYGLDKPLSTQYLIYMQNILKGDLGISTTYRRPVNTIISEAIVYSFDLGMRALVFACVSGVFLGIVAAINRGRFLDYFCTFTAIIGVSVPSFIVGALINYYLAVELKLNTGITFFPVSGWGSESAKILPSFALSFGSLATISRLMRTSMLDVLNSDYIKTAKAKGLSPVKIISNHAIRNSITPVVTVIGPIAASLLTGAFIIENIFSIPGLGKFFVLSIQGSDYTLIAGVTVFYGAFLIAANLIVDIVYGLIDPRVKLSS